MTGKILGAILIVGVGAALFSLPGKPEKPPAADQPPLLSPQVAPIPTPDQSAELAELREMNANQQRMMVQYDEVISHLKAELQSLRQREQPPAAPAPVSQAVCSSPACGTVYYYVPQQQQYRRRAILPWRR
jgi:hypothetical protein